MRKYCSTICAGVAPNAVTLICAICGNEYQRVPAHAQGSKYCTAACQNEAFARKRHPNPKGKPVKLRCSRAAWQRLRLVILERDKFTCQDCGAVPPRRVTVHHIVKERRGGPDTESNLVTLCVGCHTRRDARDGRK